MLDFAKKKKMHILVHIWTQICFANNLFQYFYINPTDVEVLEATFAVGGFSNVKALQVGILGGEREVEICTLA